MLKLDKIFCNGIVFPKGKKIRIHGFSDSSVNISFLNNNYSFSIDNDNSFDGFIEPINEYMGPLILTISNKKESISIEDIYIGEIYLMAGQSNMQYKIADGPEKVYPGKTDELLRLFSTDRLEDNEFFNSDNGWKNAIQDELIHWPSIPYQMGSVLREKYDCAIGLVACYQGGSIIEAWLSEDDFDNSIELEISKKHPDHTEPYYLTWNNNSTLYNYQFKPISKISYSGVCYYQGESDTTVEEAEIYDIELIKLVNTWRKDIKDNTLPFVIIQISDYNDRDDLGWHSIQKAQERAVKKIEYSSLVISKDVCESEQIHPANKQELSERVANSFGKLQQKL